MTDKINELFEQESFENLDEILTTGQRFKKRAQFRKIKAKVARGRAKAKKRIASNATVEKRTRRQAIRDVKKTLSKGKSTSDMSPAERAAVERKVARRGAQVDRLVKKLRPTVRKRSRRLESLEMKAENSGIPLDIIQEVYERGVKAYDPSTTVVSEDQYAFARVNSFISGGSAIELDKDLAEKLDVVFPNLSTNTFNRINRGGERIGGVDYIGKAKSALKRIIIPRGFEQTISLYIKMVQDNPTKNQKQLAAMAANEIGILRPREFVDFINKQIKNGKLPQSLMAEYDPSQGEE